MKALKKIFRNSKGFSLIEVMMAMGMMGGTAVYIAQMTKNTVESQKRLEFKMDTQELEYRLGRLTSNKRFCETNFNGSVFPPPSGSAEFGSAIPVSTFVHPISGDALFETGGPWGNHLTIEQMVIRRDRANNLRLRIDVGPRQNSSGQSNAQNNRAVKVMDHFRKTFYVHVRTVINESTNRVEECGTTADDPTETVCTDLLDGEYDEATGECKESIFCNFDREIAKITVTGTAQIEVCGDRFEIKRHSKKFHYNSPGLSNGAGSLYLTHSGGHVYVHNSMTALLVSGGGGGGCGKLKRGAGGGAGKPVYHKHFGGYKEGNVINFKIGAGGKKSYRPSAGDCTPATRGGETYIIMKNGSYVYSMPGQPGPERCGGGCPRENGEDLYFMGENFYGGNGQNGSGNPGMMGAGGGGGKSHLTGTNNGGDGGSGSIFFTWLTKRKL